MKTKLLVALLILCIIAIAVLAWACTRVGEVAASDVTPSFLFVQQASSGSFTQDQGADTYTLTLQNVEPQMQFFSDRPERLAGHETVESFVRAWADNGFAQEPPNAALVLLDEASDQDAIIVELTNPVYDANAKVLSYTAVVLEDGGSQGVAFYAARADASIPEQFGRANLFIDSAAPSGDIITLRTYEPYSSGYDLYMLSAIAAVGPEARQWLKDEISKLHYPVDQSEILFLTFDPDKPNGVIWIKTYGTRISSEGLSEFDVYAFMVPDYAPESVERIVGYTVKISSTMTTSVKAPHSGTVHASGDWSGVDGKSVKAGETLFSIETATGGVRLTLEVADIVSGNLPFGVTASKIYDEWLRP